MSNGQVAVVVIVNRSRLDQKYQGAAGVVAQALDALLDSYAAREMLGRIVDVSDGPTMAALGVPTVGNVADERATKDAVDAAFREYLPDYVVLVGGPDVLAHQTLSNPLGNNGTDMGVPSDLPYASNAPYGEEISSFLSITRVVGRIPDPPGGTDPDCLVRILRHATQPTVITNPGTFGLTAQAWQGSTERSLRVVDGAGSLVRSSPADGPDWDEQTLAGPLHFINCHGAPASAEFLGDPGAPVSHRAQRLVGRVTPGTVVAAECCYGAELFDSALTGGIDGIALTYLREGAAGFFGSTNISYGPADFPAFADVLCAEFLRRVRDGASIGRACAEARQAYVTATAILGPTDLKTLGQFLLLGDPTRTPIPAGVASPNQEESGWAARRLRRLNIVGNGTKLAERTAFAVAQPTGAQSSREVAQPPGAVAEVVRRWQMAGSDVLAFDVAVPREIAEVRPEPSIEMRVLLRREEGPFGHLPRIVNLAVTVRDDEVIGVVRAESR